MSLFEHAVLVERSEHFKLLGLQLRELGLEHMPAVPVDIAGALDSLVMLGIRAKQGEQAYQGLTKAFTIGHFAA